MKKIISFLLVSIVLFHFLTFSFAEADTWICSKGHMNSEEALFCGKCGEKRIKEDSKWICSNGHENSPENDFCIFCGEKRVEEAKELENQNVSDYSEIQNKKEMEEAFGLEGKDWVENPQTNRDYLNNFLLSFCAGEWEYLTDSEMVEPSSVIWAQDLKPICILYNALLGAFSNQNEFYVAFIGDRFYIVTSGIEPYFSKGQLMEQQKEAVQKAISIREELITSGKLNVSMSEKECCDAYYSYLSSQYIQSSSTKGIDHQALDPVYRTVFMRYDSAYACLVNKVADCVGISAGLTLLMNLEKISAFGVSGKMIGAPSNHVLTYLVLDGEEYFSDFANNIATGHIDSDAIVNRFVVDKSYLDDARKEAGLENKEDVNDYFVIKSKKDSGENIDVECYILPESPSFGNAECTIRYGVDGNSVVYNGILLQELKKGIACGFRKDAIKKHNILPIISVVVEGSLNSGDEERFFICDVGTYTIESVIGDNFIVESITDAGKNIDVSCSVLPEYSADTNIKYSIRYGVEGNNTHHDGISIKDLKHGHTFGFSKDVIKQHNIPPVISLTIDESSIKELAPEKDIKNTYTIESDVGDYFVVESIVDAGKNIDVRCSVSSEYSPETNDKYTVNYGVNGNCIIKEGISLQDFKRGITLGFSKDTIKQHNIPPIISFRKQ